VQAFVAGDELVGKGEALREGREGGGSKDAYKENRLEYDKYSTLPRSLPPPKPTYRHQPPLLQPEDRAKRPAEENPLYRRKGNQPLSERGVLPVTPPEGPLRLTPDTRDSVNGIKELVLLLPVLDVGVDKQGVDFAVDVLDGDLEAVEAAGLLFVGGREGGREGEV